MVKVYLRDVDNQPDYPLSLTVKAVPVRGDRITYWDSGEPGEGGLGMTADVEAVRHSFYRAKGDHMIFLVLTNVRTIDAEGKALPA